MKKYINSISAFQFYQLVRYSTLILVGIVFAKSALTQTEIGEYETFLFLAGAVSFFWLNGLQKALLPLQSEKSTSHIFSAFLIIQFFSLLAAAFVFILQPLFSAHLLNGNEIPEIWLLLVFIAAGVPANLVEIVYLIKKQNKALIMYSLLSFFVQFLLTVAPVLLGFGISAAFKGLVLSSVLRYIWLWILFFMNDEIRFSTEFIKEHLKLGAPLVAASFLSGSAQYVDGFIVTSWFDEGTFAVFRYGARELPLAILLTNALSSAMLAEFANRDRLKENLARLKTSITRLMHFLFPATAVLLLISHPVFPVVFNPKFAESATVFNIYLLLIISRVLLPQTILNGLQMTKPLVIASVLELSVNVILSLVLGRFFGIAGIAFATFIAYFVEKIYLASIVKIKLKIAVHEYLPVKAFIFYSLGISTIFALAEKFFS